MRSGVAPWQRLAAAGVFVFLAPQAARAGDSARECIGAHTEGQTLRSRGQLVAAREKFLSCATRGCPAVIHAECAKFAEEVEAAVPTAVLAAITRGGVDVRQAWVHIDDARVATPLDGRAIALDPGPHTFKFVLVDGRSLVVSALLRESEKYRRLVADFSEVPAAPRASMRSPVTIAATVPAEAALPPTPVAVAPTVAKRAVRPHPVSEEDAGGSRTSPLAYVFGGLGLVAIASFSAFAVAGNARESALDRCRPDCEDARVDGMYRFYLAADISLGVALASLGAGAYFLLRPEVPARAPSPAPRAAHPRAPSTRVGAALRADGGVSLSLLGAF